MPPLSVDERIQRVSDICCISRNLSRLLLEKHAWNCDTAICGYGFLFLIEVQLFWRRTGVNSVKTEGKQKEPRNKGTGHHSTFYWNKGRMGEGTPFFFGWGYFYRVFWFGHHCGYLFVSGTRVQSAPVSQKSADCYQKCERVTSCTLPLVPPDRP